MSTLLEVAVSMMLVSLAVVARPVAGEESQLYDVLNVRSDVLMIRGS